MTEKSEYSLKLLEKLEDEVNSCINCGFCESVCPTLPSSGFRSSIGARGRVDVGKEMIREIKGKGIIELKVDESFYSCLDCYACLQVCPAGVNAGKVSEIGKEIITSGELTIEDQKNPIADMIVELTMKYRNPLGIREVCAGWSAGLQFESESTNLLYTGNMYQMMAYNETLGKIEKSMGDAFSKNMARYLTKHSGLSKYMKYFRNKKTEREMNSYLKNIYSLLKDSGIKFTYLHEEEPYPGTFIYDLGYEKEFSEYAKYLCDLFHERKVKTIITVDPHTYDLLKNTIPSYVTDFDFKVIYYLDLLEENDFQRTSDNITYHEPCHLVLRGEGYNRPKKLLESIAKVSMPFRSGKKVFCCGGPDELLYGKLSSNISEERFRQLKETGTEKIITACPICLSNLKKDDSVEDISSYLINRRKDNLKKVQ